MNEKQALSIVIPTLNESGNITSLFERIDTTLAKARIPYEIIVIDDHSTDGTIAIVKKLAARYNVRTFTKKGKPGKAYSLLEGFELASNSLICMIDADLQYPPEAIAPMHDLLIDKNADIVISERHDNETSFLRKLSSKTFNFVFARLLFGINYDTQSGLKLFKKRVLNDFSLSPSPWSFDLEFIVRSLENERRILSYEIAFAERHTGTTKVRLLSSTFELAKASVVLRLKSSAAKIQAGHKANTQFLKKVFPLLGATLLVGAITGLSAPKTQALELPRILSPILTPIGLGPENQEDTTAEPIQNNQPVATNATATPEGAKTTGQMLQAILSPQSGEAQSSPATPTPASSNANSPATTSGPLRVSDQSPSNMPTLSVSRTIDNSKLSAATASKPFSDYASGYPTASISGRAKSSLLLIAKIAALVSGVYFLYFMIRNMRSAFKNRFTESHRA